jgi:hypothetical protein
MIRAITPPYRWLETYYPALHNNSDLSNIEVHNILASNLVLHVVGVGRAAQLSVNTCSCNKEVNQ